MKKIIAMALSLIILISCAAALAETDGKEDMGVLKVEKAFNIRYSKLPDDYELRISTQNPMTIIASILTPNATLPRMRLTIAFNEEWSGVERLNDVIAAENQNDLEEIKESFLEEHEEVSFEIRETSLGTQLLVVTAENGQEATIYTIYQSHEIEMLILPGYEQEKLTEEDLERVIRFLSDMDFVPVE